MRDAPNKDRRSDMELVNEFVIDVAIRHVSTGKYKHNICFTKQSLVFTILNSKGLENTVGKRRKCWSPTFSPFPKVFFKERPNHSSQYLIYLCKCL